MFNIIKDGETIATVDQLQFFTRQRNGVPINCPESEANGVVVNDTFYHLPYLPQSGGGEADVTYEAFSGADAIAELDEAVIGLEYQNILLELGVSE